MIAAQTGRIVEWDPRKGFGFLESGGRRLFLHFREFSELLEPPRVGDRVAFLLGEDDRGRPCAQNVQSLSSHSGLKAVHLVIFPLLLALPMLAILNSGIDLRWACGYAILISVVAWFSNRGDKRRAKRGAWRTSESMLHFLELAGGWPGAFLAQRAFRHKVAKRPYQFVFWSIVSFHQFVALELLTEWPVFRSARSALQTWLG